MYFAFLSFASVEFGPKKINCKAVTITPIAYHHETKIGTAAKLLANFLNKTSF